MKTLLALSRLIDALNERVGRLVYWLVLVVVLVSAGNATVRYAFNLSSNAWLELQWYLFSAVFLLCAGYTLLHNEHIRIDVVAARLSRRAQIWIDIFGTLFFLLPMALIIMWLSWPIFMDAWTQHEMSSNAGGLMRWPVRLLIPVGFFLLALQGVSELIKRIAFLMGLIPDPVGEARGSGARARCKSTGSRRNDRLPHRQHGAADVRGAGRVPAARLPGRVRAGRDRPALRLPRHRARPAAPALFQALPERIFGIMRNDTLLAVPFFTFMGLILERSGMAEDLLDTIGQLFGPMRGGLAYAVIFVGALLAATTGVVAASVISMGLISLPIMLRYGYDRRLASGVIAASGTLAQIIPPSLVLIVLADQLGRSVGDMYAGAIIPGLMLTGPVRRSTCSVDDDGVRPAPRPALPPEARTAARLASCCARVFFVLIPPLR